MVWSQAPIWQRDSARGVNLLAQPKELARALLTVRRTVTEARNHPAVLTHSVANELTFTPDQHPATKRFLLAARAQAHQIDPTLPISVDIKGRPGFAEQFTYHPFDMIGLNQYFGWYRWVAGLQPARAVYLRAARPVSAQGDRDDRVGRRGSARSWPTPRPT